MMSNRWTLVALFWLLSATTWAQEKVQLSSVWRVAEAEGRTLWVSEQSVSLRADERTLLQIGWQRFVAKGKVRTNRFSTSARWYGVERLLQQGDDRQLALSWRRLEGGEGVADVAEGLFTYVAPRVESVSLFSLQRERTRTTGYRLSYSRTRAGTERAETFGAAFHTTSAWSSIRGRVQLEGSIYADRYRGETAYRPVLSAEVAIPLGERFQAHLGAVVAPRGFPIAGTSVEGLTAFVVFQPGSLVESWRDRPAGFLTLQITIGR